jgi:hypothetical protein
MTDLVLLAAILALVALAAGCFTWDYCHRDDS